MEKVQNNSSSARTVNKYKRLRITVSFVLMYFMLLNVGAGLFFCSGIINKSGKWWPAYLIVGLIVLASSLLGKMLRDCFH
jgi:hypothetical protein